MTQSGQVKPGSFKRWLTPQTLTWLVVGLLVAQLAFWVVFRAVNLDEGWYLWAGQEVFRGRLLYRDFAFTQTPLLPYVYGAVQGVFGSSLYLGRIVTALFGLAAALLSAATARRLAGPWAGFFALLILASTVLVATAYTFTATYGLASAMLAGAFYLALRLAPGSQTRGAGGGGPGAGRGRAAVDGGRLPAAGPLCGPD